MFEGWTLQKWIGKVLLLAVGIAGLVAKGFGVEVPWAAIILPLATQVGQWFLAWVPGTGWQIVVGKLLLLAETIVTFVLSELGVQVQVWVILAPMVIAFGQYLISLLPAPEPS